MFNLIKTEPARFVAFVMASIGVADAFNLWHPTQAQLGSIMTLVGVIGGEYIRSVSTPTAKLP